MRHALVVSLIWCVTGSACSRTPRKSIEATPPPSATASPSASPSVTPTPSPGAMLPPVGVLGTLTREGKVLDLATAPIIMKGKRCREASETGLSLGLWLPAAASQFNVDDQVVALSLDPAAGISLDEELVMQLEGQSFDPALHRKARVLAWISEDGRAASAHLPVKASLKTHALSPAGPIDLTFELDFGALGAVRGRARVDTLEETTCVIPAPPPPPSATPKPRPPGKPPMPKVG